MSMNIKVSSKIINIYTSRTLTSWKQKFLQLLKRSDNNLKIMHYWNVPKITKKSWQLLERLDKNRQIISFFRPKRILKMMVISIARVWIPLLSNPSPHYWPGGWPADIASINFGAPNRAHLPMFIHKTITKTTSVRFEHAL